MSALKKRYGEIKRSKCSEPRKKRKSETSVKIYKCPIVELGVQDTHLRGKKRRASHSPHKVSKSKEGMYPLKRAKVE